MQYITIDSFSYCTIFVFNCYIHKPEVTNQHRSFSHAWNTIHDIIVTSSQWFNHVIGQSTLLLLHKLFGIVVYVLAPFNFSWRPLFDLTQLGGFKAKVDPQLIPVGNWTQFGANVLHTQTSYRAPWLQPDSLVTWLSNNPISQHRVTR